MRWTWDPEKDRVNLRKHRIRFAVAQLVFSDADSITEADDYPFEPRWRTTGTIGQILVIVIHTLPEFPGEAGRIISARRATRTERRLYEEGYGQTYRRTES